MPTTPISLSPSYALGYLCGWVIGDASIIANRRNYVCSLETTKQDTALCFSNAVAKALPQVKLFSQHQYKTRSFPNGTTKTDLMTTISFNSKLFYQALRPYKLPDFHWAIPEFLTTKEAKAGFLCGIFDAEGSVGRKDFANIVLASKHKANLEQVAVLLEKEYDIHSHLPHSTGCFKLQISSLPEAIKFLQHINFNLPHKKLALVEALHSYDNRFSKRQNLSCVTCGKLFHSKGRRGPVPKNCPACAILRIRNQQRERPIY